MAGSFIDKSYEGIEKFIRISFFRRGRKNGKYGWKVVQNDKKHQNEGC